MKTAFNCPACGVAVHAEGITCEECTALGIAPTATTTTATTTTEKPAPLVAGSRSYTKRVEIAGKCVMVTLTPTGVELRAKYGRQRAEWSFEKLWDAAEGKLL